MAGGGSAGGATAGGAAAGGGAAGGATAGGTAGGAVAPLCDAGTSRIVFAEGLAVSPVGASPMLAVDRDGTVWVAENDTTAGGPRVTQLFADGGRIERLDAGSLGAVTGLAFDQAGNLYVGDGVANGLSGSAGQNRVMRRTPAGAVSVFALVPNPTGIAVDSQSRVYVASWNDKAVYRFLPDGGPLGQFGPTMMERPAGIAFDPADHLYVGGMGALPTDNSGGQKIYEISPAGQLRVHGDPGIADAYVPSVAPNGRVWASYYNGLKLVRFEADAGFEVFPGGWTGDDAANGIAFNPAGDLFVLVNGGRTTATPAVVQIKGVAPPVCR